MSVCNPERCERVVTLQLGRSSADIEIIEGAFVKDEDIPRCPKMDGSTLRIVPSLRTVTIYTEAAQSGDVDRLTVTDGMRAAVYVPAKGAQKLSGGFRRIVPSFTEGGGRKEAHCITVTDGGRTAFYVPLKRASFEADRPAGLP